MFFLPPFSVKVLLIFDYLHNHGNRSLLWFTVHSWLFFLTIKFWLLKFYHFLCVGNVKRRYGHCKIWVVNYIQTILSYLRSSLTEYIRIFLWSSGWYDVLRSDVFSSNHLLGKSHSLPGSFCMWLTVHLLLFKSKIEIFCSIDVEVPSVCCEYHCETILACDMVKE